MPPSSDANCSRCHRPLEAPVTRLHGGFPALLGLIGTLLAYSLTGGLAGEFLEGMQRSRLGWWKLLAPIPFLLGAAAAAFARWRRPICEACERPPWTWILRRVPRIEGVEVDSGRRILLQRLTGLAAAATAASVAVLARNREWGPIIGKVFLTPADTQSRAPRAEWADAHIRGYRRLGRTNAMVSDISLGSARITDVDVARYALDRGINYFDTSPDYAGSTSEQVLGAAMKGRRQDVFVATKFCRGDGHLHLDESVPQVIAAVEASLRRLQTDYVDLIHIHSCNRVERLLAPNLHEAFDRLKEQGKVRFLGVSSHAPNLPAVASAAIESGRFDVLMMAFHFGLWPTFGDLLARAHEHDLGVVAMKTLKGAKHQNLAEFADGEPSYPQSAFRWVLSHPEVSCLVVSIESQAQVDEYAYASGTALRAQDVAALERYDRLIAGDYCQPHCGACLDHCIYDLAINDILRHRMYALDYGWPSEGKLRYAQLERQASVCTGCAAPCANACPLGVPIQTKLIEAHRLLSA